MVKSLLTGDERRPVAAGLGIAIERRLVAGAWFRNYVVDINILHFECHVSYLDIG